MANPKFEVNEEPSEKITIKGDQPLTPETEEKEPTKEVMPSEKLANSATTKKTRKFWPPTKKQLLIASGILLVLVVAIVAVLPVRNAVAGLFIRTSATVEAYDEFTDEETGAVQRLQLSDLEVKVDGKTVATNATSPVKLQKVRPGKRGVTISKTNYKTVTTELQANLHLGSQTNNGSYKMVATGRPVKVMVVNSITSEPLADATIKAGDGTSKTDSGGHAVVVVPVSSATEYEVKISKDGFNETKQKLTAPSKPSQKTTSLPITPSGKVYFLSKQSGKIDVVKTNLDGSDREVVLAGTGKEDNTTTSLIATTDWRYLALYTRRSDKKYSLILIDTKTDNNTVIDEGDASFTLTGWSGKQLVYYINSNTIPEYQGGKYKLKTYNAETKTLKTIFQNQASGTSVYNYTSEYPDQVRLVSGRVVYVVEPNESGNGFPPGQGSIRSSNVDGSNGKTLYTFESAKGYISLLYTSATEAYYSFTEYGSAGAVTYYEVSSSGAFKQGQRPDKTDQFTYLISPDASQTLWSEEQDGKQTVFVGNADGSSPKELYRLSELKPFGWYTKGYALYSKNNSELYIAALKENAEPKKISDYHRPSQVEFVGYGGGYGGAY